MVGADHIDEIVAQWRRERPELNTEPLAVFGRLFRAAALADSLLGEQLAGYSLQPGWFDLLAALRRAGEPAGLNPTQLMRATMLSSGGTTKRLDRLAEAGLIERRPDPRDRRGVLVRLTPRGTEVIDKAIETHLGNEGRLLQDFAPADRRALAQLLRRLLAVVEEGQDGFPGQSERSPRARPVP
jgi:DNA-binding MarR family transcriptional regulator